MYLLFFFKQKTAYEVRISDWSSDVCSSDLGRAPARAGTNARFHGVERHLHLARGLARRPDDPVRHAGGDLRGAGDRRPRRAGRDRARIPGAAGLLHRREMENGRATGRERWRQNASISGGPGSQKTKKKHTTHTN